MKKLTRILLINWLYYQKELIELGDINFLTGKNSVGKSTVIDALQIVLLGETNSRNFNQAANDRSQRTLDGYLRADTDDKNPFSRRGKDFSTYIACEYYDDVNGNKFVTGVIFDCRSDGSRQDRFFIYVGGLPDHCFIENGEAMDLPTFRKYLKANYNNCKIYETQKEYRTDMLSRWNVHNEQALRMLKKAVSFKPIDNIQKFITENICDIPDKLDINAMQQNIRDYKRHELLAQKQEQKLDALQGIDKLYRDMNQADERYKIQNFLVSWSEKENEIDIIHDLEAENKKYKNDLSLTSNEIDALQREINATEKERQDLQMKCAQSDVYKEAERLRSQKERLQSDQINIRQNLSSCALEIRKESTYISSLNHVVQQWMESEILTPVKENAEIVVKNFAKINSGNPDIFALPISDFEKVQVASSSLAEAIQRASHLTEEMLSEDRDLKYKKQTALKNLKNNIKDYPSGLQQFKKRLESELELRLGHEVHLYILADVLEIAEESWRGAVEGYLNTQKFYLLVDPSIFEDALLIYDQLKHEDRFHSFGLVDVGKLKEKENINARQNSLATKVTTENPLARDYVDYLLGRVICCDNVLDLRNHKTAITAEGMLYQGYVARRIRKELMEDAFIGRQAIKLRITRLEEELKLLEERIGSWSPINDILSKKKEYLFTEYFVHTIVSKKLDKYLRGLSVAKEISELEEQLQSLDLCWLDEQRKNIDKMQKHIHSLQFKKDERNSEKGKLEERIYRLDYETLPEHDKRLSEMDALINETFSEEYQSEVGIPRYQQELERLHKAEIILRNFNSSLAQSEKATKDTRTRLFTARREFADEFGPCSFKIDSMDNNEFEAEEKMLRESELPQYKEKIRILKESAMEQFQNDFLAKLKSHIEQVQKQVDRLNKALRKTEFGTDKYQFRVNRNPDYAEYYDMIMAPELMEGDGGLFAIPFQKKYGNLIEELFRKITMADDTQLNARKQSDLQENIERYTDFRTYLQFDLETTDQNGSTSLLSKTLNIKSGGETQTPFYIAVLASFAQIYRVDSSSDFGNTVRLVVFDEAFNKMDSERIVESVRLLRKLGLQAIICTPPDKVADIMPIADRTLLVNKEKYRMYILPFSKEMTE